MSFGTDTNCMQFLRVQFLSTGSHATPFFLATSLMREASADVLHSRNHRLRKYETMSTLKTQNGSSCACSHELPRLMESLQNFHLDVKRKVA